MRALVYIANDGKQITTKAEADAAGCADKAILIEVREVETPEQEAERLARIARRMVALGKPELA